MSSRDCRDCGKPIILGQTAGTKRWIVLDNNGNWGTWRIVRHDASGLAIVREERDEMPDCYRRHQCR